MRSLVVGLRVLPWLLALPFLKRMLPLPRLVRLAWVQPRAGRRDRGAELAAVSVVRLLFRARKVIADDNCLERSLVSYRLLSRLGARPQLVVALSHERAEAKGHVWVVVDGSPVAENAEHLRAYTPLMCFDAQGRLVSAAAS